MPDHLYTVVATGVSNDAQTGLVTLYALVDTLGGSGMPFAFPELAVVTEWLRCPGEEGRTFVQRTRMLDPDGQEVFHSDVTFRLERARQRCITRVGMLPFRKVGTHIIEVLIRAEQDGPFTAPVARYPILVNLMQAPVGDPTLSLGGTRPSTT